MCIFIYTHKCIFCNIIWYLHIKTINLRHCTFWPSALHISIYAVKTPSGLILYHKILCNQTMAVQSESNEKNKSLKPNLHYLLLKDLEKPAWNWTWTIRQNEMLWAFLYWNLVFKCNIIFYFTLRLLQHATRVCNNNSMALIENTSFLHENKHLKILKKARHRNLLEMRRKLKSSAVKVFPEFLSY